MDAKLLFIHALSPLHAGTGQGVGAIDLPIAREKATNLPYLPGSSLKGVLRDACTDGTTRKEVFGPETTHAADYAGSVHFTDQRLLFMPIRSLSGTFAWVTSPLVLRRFSRDVALAQGADFPANVPDVTPSDGCLVTNATNLIGNDGKVTLEDIPLTPARSAEMDAWAQKFVAVLFPQSSEWKDVFTARLCLVHDEIFGFLVETATEVVARIALDDEVKTVKQGALWYEESLPAESILSGLVVASPVRAEAHTVFKTVDDIIANPLQLGGHATVGRGLCSLHMVS
ncbi:MAG: type III-B CRISPR module RAMP protein Cmr4 [Gammaproteobacteria bacterium]|nr:MAG: type III-B CRISPR module RAMP protein Cmr4 [Gammaproteobacteria bacterium]